VGFKELVASDAHGQHGAVRLGLRYFVTLTVSASILLRAADRLLEAGWTWPSRIVRTRLANEHGVHTAKWARVGPESRLPHPVNVVIGPGTEIGSNVSVYQSVTLGAVVVGHNVVVRSTSEERTRVSNRESEGPARAAPGTPDP